MYTDSSEFVSKHRENLIEYYMFFAEQKFHKTGFEVILINRNVSILLNVF